jgi:hypothetical protein
MRKLLPLALVIALVAVPGCGGGKSGEKKYAEAVTKAQVDLATTLTKAQSKPATSAKGAADQASAIKAAIDKDVVSLKAVKPPDKVAGLHKQLISELNQLGRGIGDMAAAFGAKDRKALVAARTKVALDLANVGTRIQSTIAAINRELRG